MIKAIVYKSNTGHTRQYAKMLSEKLNIPCFTIEEAKNNLQKRDEIIYFGWVCATKICGLGKVKNRYTIKCYGAVGLFPIDENYIKNLKESNKLDKDLFYMQGGLDYTKLKGIKRKILQLVGNAMEKDNKPENQEMIKIFKNGANFISDKNLEPMIKFLSTKK
ncbi:MAG: flavodoxin domain-containing protein [Candidatus Scatovivens sp.]